MKMKAFKVTGIPPPSTAPTWMEDGRNIWFDVEALSKLCRTPSPNVIKEQIQERHGIKHAAGSPLVTSGRFKAFPKPRLVISPDRKGYGNKSIPLSTFNSGRTSNYAMVSLTLDDKVTTSQSSPKCASGKRSTATKKEVTVAKRQHGTAMEDISLHPKILELSKKVDDLIIELKEKELYFHNDLRKLTSEAEEKEKQILEEHMDHIRSIEGDHEEELDQIRALHQKTIDEAKARATEKEADLQKQVDTLKNSLQLFQDKFEKTVASRVRQREKEVQLEMERMTEKKLMEQKLSMIQQKNLELDKQAKDHGRQVTMIVEDHKREIDKLFRKFAASTVDAERLKETLQELDSLRSENADLRMELKALNEKRRKQENELADTKVKLSAYQEHFAEKVAEVDDKYVMRIHSLMAENTDLRKAHVRKCDELFQAQASLEVKQGKARSSVKDALKAVIEARHRSDVDLTGNYTSMENAVVNTNNAVYDNIDRPRSAPSGSRMRVSIKTGGESALVAPNLLPKITMESMTSNQPTLPNARIVKSAGPSRTRVQSAFNAQKPLS